MRAVLRITAGPGYTTAENSNVEHLGDQDEREVGKDFL